MSEPRDRPPLAGDEPHGDPPRSDEPRRDAETRGDEPRRDGEPPERPAATPGGGGQPPSFRGIGIALVVAVLAAALFVGLIAWRRHHQLAEEAERRSREVDRGPRIFVTEVRTQPGARDLTLPADVRGFFQSTMYAKVTGYVRTIDVDKGDHVREGQLLARLESPEVDQQVAAAVADLDIRNRTFERYRQLVGRDFVSKQDYDTVRSQLGVSTASLRQARALQAYKVLRAPFAGTVTARYVDPGALVPAASGAGQSAQPIVDIADLRRLRITVFVQQDAAPFLKVGDPVDITVDQRPDLKIRAPLTRFARALDPRSRTMLCEIWVDNPHELFPGTFVHVTLHLRAPTLPVVPSAALLIHDNKPAVAVVRDDRLHFVTVRPGIDDGKVVQLLEGVTPGERVALSVPAELPDGAQVQAIEQKQAAGAPPPPAARKGVSPQRPNPSQPQAPPPGPAKSAPPSNSPNGPSRTPER